MNNVKQTWKTSERFEGNCFWIVGCARSGLARSSPQTQSADLAFAIERHSAAYRRRMIIKAKSKAILIKRVGSAGRRLILSGAECFSRFPSQPAIC